MSQPEPIGNRSPLTAPATRFHIPLLQEAGLLIVVFLLGAALSIYGYIDAKPGEKNTFLNPHTLVDLVITPMSWYAIMAVGVTFVIITGGIDISVGSIFAVSALCAAYILQRMPADAPAYQVLPVAFLIAPGVGLLCGLLNGALVVALRLHPFIVTLGTMSIFRCIATFGFPGTLPDSNTNRSIPMSLTDHFMRSEVIGDLRLMPLIVMFVCIILSAIYLWLTIEGRKAYAVGGNEEAARFSGLHVGRIKLSVYALSGLAAGIAGLVSLGRFGTVSSNTGTGYELDVIAAAVVGGASLSGGRGTAIGALFGALIIQLIQTAVDILHWRSDLRLGIVGISIIVAVVIDRLSDDLRKRHMARRGAR